MAYPQSSSSAAVSDTMTTVIGAHYCSPYPRDLTIVREVRTLVSRSKITVTDAANNGNTLLRVKASLVTIFTPRQSRVLLDPAGNPIVTLRRELITAHDRWHAFRGESTEPSDLIFTMKLSSAVLTKSYDVFLANNGKGEVCDFKVKSSWDGRSCDVYAADSNTMVAQMDKKLRFSWEKEKIMVRVFPNIDYAFIVALIVIFDDLD